MGLILGGYQFLAFYGGKTRPLVWEIIMGHVTCDVVHTQNAISDSLYIMGAC